MAADQARENPRLVVVAGPRPSALIGNTNQFLAPSSSPPSSRPIIMVPNSLPAATVRRPDTTKSSAAFLSLTAATQRPIIAPAGPVPAAPIQLTGSSPRGVQSSTPEKGDAARRGNGVGGGGGGRKRGGKGREKGVGRTLAQVLSFVAKPCYPATAGEWVKLFEGYHVDSNVEETVLTFDLSNGRQWKKRIWPRKSYPKKLHRCNTAEEILSYLISLDKHPDWVLDQVPSKPPSGSILFFDKSKTRNYRIDGYDWKTRRNNEKVVREDRMKLKVNGFQLLYGCYTHSASNPNFHRRSYWLLQNPDVIMVHYLDVDPNPSSQFVDKQSEEVSPISYSAPLCYELLVISDWNLTAALSAVSSLEEVRLLLQQLVQRLDQSLQESGSLLEAIEKGNRGMCYDPFEETRTKKQRSTPGVRHRIPVRVSDETRRNVDKLSKVLSVSASGSSEQMMCQREISKLLSRTPQIILCFPQNGSLSYVLLNGDLRSKNATAIEKGHVSGNLMADKSKEGSVSQLQKHMANLERPSKTVSESISNSPRASSKRQEALTKSQAMPPKSTALQKPTEGDRVREATPSTAVTAPSSKRGDYDPDQFSKFASFLTSMGPIENLTTNSGTRRERKNTMGQEGRGNRARPGPHPPQDEVQNMDSNLAFSCGLPVDSVYGNQTGDNTLELPPSPQSDGCGSDISLPLSPTSLEQLLADCPSPTSTAWNVLDDQNMETDPLSPTSQLLENLTPADLDGSSVMISTVPATTSFQGTAENPPAHLHTEMGGAFPNIVSANVQMTDLTGDIGQHFVPPSLQAPPSSSQTSTTSDITGQNGSSNGFIWSQGLQKGSTARSIREWLEAASTIDTQQVGHPSSSNSPPIIIPLDMLCPEDVERLLQQCNRQQVQRNIPATDIASLLSGSGAGGPNQQPSVLVVSTSDIDSLLPDGELEKLMNLAQNSTAEDVVTFTSDSLPSLSSTLELVQSVEDGQQGQGLEPDCSNESALTFTTNNEASCPPMLDLSPGAASPAQHVLKDTTLPEWGTPEDVESSSPPHCPAFHSPLSVTSAHFATTPDFSDSLPFSPAPPSVATLHTPPDTSSSAQPHPSLLHEDITDRTSFPNLPSPPFPPHSALSPMQSLEDICSATFDTPLQDIPEDIQMELEQQQTPALQLEGQELNLAEQAAYRIPSSLPSSPSLASVSSQSTLSLQDVPFEAVDSPSVVELCELLSESPNVQQEDFSHTVLTGTEQQEVFHAAQVIQGAFRKYTQNVQQTRARQKHAANVIESYYKRYKELKKQREQAAKRIQQQYRMYKRRVHEMNRAATFIQQMYRFHRIRRIDHMSHHRPRRNSPAGPRPNN